MLVRLTIAWTDPLGRAHGAGDVVDIDAITLAELEERGVVDNMTENPQKAWTGPTAPPEDDEAQAAWTGPTSPPKEDDPSTDGWTGPTSEPGDNA